MSAYALFNLYPSELAIAALALVSLGLWGWAIIHCAINETDKKKKTIWLLLILFGGYIGAPAYFVRNIIRNKAGT